MGMMSERILGRALVLSALACLCVATRLKPYNGTENEDAERSALTALYSGTIGSRWSIEETMGGPHYWTMSEYHHCSWYGVGCKERYVNENVTENLVTEIILPGASMNGHLPSELATLQDLTILRLFNNNLNGGIPDAFGELENLEELWLQNNGLTGTVPASLANLAKLKQLRLDSNAITGTLPSGLGNPESQPNLEMVSCSNNNFDETSSPWCGYHFRCDLRL